MTHEQQTNDSYFGMFDDREVFTPLSPQFSLDVLESSATATDPIANQTTLSTRQGPAYAYSNTTVSARAQSQHLGLGHGPGTKSPAATSPGSRFSATASSPSPGLLASTINRQGGSPVYSAVPVAPYGFQPALGGWTSSSGYTSGDSANNSQFFEMNLVGQNMSTHHGPPAYSTDFIAPDSIQQQSSLFEGFAPNPWHDSKEGVAATSPGITDSGTQMSLPSMSHNTTTGKGDAISGSITHHGSATYSRQKRAKKATAASPQETPTSPGAVSTTRRMSRSSLVSNISGKSSVSANMGSGNTAGGNKSKLRSASRASKNTHHKPAETPEERKTRASHNLVEKQYRNRLNIQFENLLNSLPDLSRDNEGEVGEDGDVEGERRVSKAEVLDMARRHIKQLEKDKLGLETERDQLLQMMETLRETYAQELSSQNFAGLVQMETQSALDYQVGPGPPYQNGSGPSYTEEANDADKSDGITQSQHQ